MVAYTICRDSICSGVIEIRALNSRCMVQHLLILLIPTVKKSYPLSLGLRPRISALRASKCNLGDWRSRFEVKWQFMLNTTNIYLWTFASCQGIVPLSHGFFQYSIPSSLVPSPSGCCASSASVYNKQANKQTDCANTSATAAQRILISSSDFGLHDVADALSSIKQFQLPVTTNCVSFWLRCSSQFLTYFRSEFLEVLKTVHFWKP